MKKRLSLIVVGCFVLMFAASVALAKDYNVDYDEFVYVYSDDGTRICANLFTPVSVADGSQATMPDTFPAIIFPNSWSVEEHEYIIQAKRFAEKGYIVFSYSSRGWGFSGGQINTVGPLDMQDLSAIIDWIIANTPVDEANIGISGISYGSGIALIGAAHDSRIKTAAAMSCWGDIVEAFYGNETPRLVWGGILVTMGRLTGRMHPEIEQNYNDLLNNQNIEEITAWGMERSPISHTDEINRRGVPVYLSPNLQDEMFRPNSVMRYYSKLTSPKLMDITRGIHASSEGLGLVGIPNKVWDNVHDWMDHWLKGIDTGIMNRAPITLDIKDSDSHIELQDWPADEITSQSYYLGKRDGFLIETGSLDNEPQTDTDSDEINSGILSGAHTGIPVISAGLEAHTPIQITTWVPGISQNKAIVYQTGEFGSSRLIAGIPTLDIWMEPSLPQAQIIAHLYDVNSLGIGTLITHGPMTLHNAVPGQPVRLSFEMVVTAYEMPEGHKLAIAIDTYDVNYGTPTDEDFTVKFHYGDEYESKLNIPYKD
ncbi:MAG: acyl esterase [Desulfobacteraceae bacterium]|nr:acyl esterase [Desulfobacteraceae bacterium]